MELKREAAAIPKTATVQIPFTSGHSAHKAALLPGQWQLVLTHPFIY